MPRGRLAAPSCRDLGGLGRCLGSRLCTSQSRYSCRAAKGISVDSGPVPQSLRAVLGRFLEGPWLFLCAKSDNRAGQWILKNVFSGLLTFAYPKRSFLAFQSSLFRFFVLLPWVVLLAPSDVARASPVVAPVSSWGSVWGLRAVGLRPPESSWRMGIQGTPPPFPVFLPNECFSRISLA